MENYKFPDWVNTLVNGAIAGALLFGVVEVSGLKERVSVMETNVLGMIKLVEQTQRTVDVMQDGKLVALEKRIEDVESVIRRPLTKHEEASAATSTWTSESTLLFNRTRATF